MQEPNEEEPQNIHFRTAISGAGAFCAGYMGRRRMNLNRKKHSVFRPPNAHAYHGGLSEQDPYDEELQKMHLSIVSLLG